MANKSAEHELPARIVLGVSELATNYQGALSPLGPEATLPVPIQRVRYRHPTPAERPHLAGDSDAAES